MDLLIQSAFPGACGGLAWFLVGLRLGRIRNNKHLKKASIEVVGGTLVGSFVSVPMIPLPEYTVSFLAGAAWSSIIQTTRQRITRKFSEEIGRDDKCG